MSFIRTGPSLVIATLSLCLRFTAAAFFCLLVSADELTPYVLGPEDQITIRAMGAEEISDKPFTIDSSGVVTLPMVGPVKASGLTVTQFESALTGKLKEFFWEPKVAVTVSEFHSQPVSVIGAVNTPGIQQLRGRKTLVEILSLSGGLRPDAGSRVTIQRAVARGVIPLPGAKLDSTGQYNVAEVSLRSIMDNSHPEENILIRPNDVISVPRADMIYVVGEVKKSGGFPLNERETVSVLQAISLSEGLQSTASPSSVRILRQQKADADRQEIAVDLKGIMSGKVPDIPLQANDILFVPTSQAKRASIRAIEAAIQLGTGLVIWRR